MSAQLFSGDIPESDRKPILSADEQEKYMIQLAIDLTEKKLRDGTASSQVICHYLKLASTREKLEKEKLEQENELLRAKTQSIQLQDDLRRLYQDALDSMQQYRYSTNEEVEGDDDIGIDEDY